MKRLALIAAVAFLVVSGAAASGDVAILADGSTVSGSVAVGKTHVEIETADGLLRIPKARVRRVVHGVDELIRDVEAPQSPRPADEEADAPAPEQPAARQPAPQQGRGPTPLAAALEQRIDVDFDGVPVTEALEFIREVTGINLVIHPRVRARPGQVYIRLRDVKIETVLDLLTDTADVYYERRPGEILFVGRAASARDHILRVYPVRDLLLSTADAGDPEDVDIGAQGGGGDSGFNPQFGQGGVETGRALLEPNGEDAGGEAYRRARALGGLIRRSCAPETWQTR